MTHMLVSCSDPYLTLAHCADRKTNENGLTTGSGKTTTIGDGILVVVVIMMKKNVIMIMMTT